MHKERELLRDTAYQLDAFIEGGYFPNPHVLLDAIIVVLNEAEEAQLYTEELKIVVNNNAYRQGYKDGKAFVNRHSEISLRDHFAGLAMQAYLSTDTDIGLAYQDVAIMSYDQADVMLNERDKNTQCEIGSGEGL